jgi:predicted O-methyltransferase YrrM
MPSLQAAQYFKETELKADVIYIDASHEKDDVKRDILAYLPLLKPGGVIFGDDYTSFAGVAIAVKEVFGLSANIIDDNFWMYGV